MSLNCLACQSVQRTDSHRDFTILEERYKKLCCIKVKRSWSGNLTPPPPPPPYEQLKNSNKKSNGENKSGPRRMSQMQKVKNGHRRAESAGALGGEPKLVRSVGMRRDWSFEDLRQIRGY